jgi:hypothetical protein
MAIKHAGQPASQKMKMWFAPAVKEFARLGYKVTLEIAQPVFS